jgi:hypothetical protein
MPKREEKSCVPKHFGVFSIYIYPSKITYHIIIAIVYDFLGNFQGKIGKYWAVKALRGRCGGKKLHTYCCAHAHVGIRKCPRRGGSGSLYRLERGGDFPQKILPLRDCRLRRQFGHPVNISIETFCLDRNTLAARCVQSKRKYPIFACASQASACTAFPLSPLVKKTRPPTTIGAGACADTLIMVL